MFAARFVGVSLAVFFLLYLVLSLAVSGGWIFLEPFLDKISARRHADLLFLVRVLPLVVSALITLALTVPSFLLLEPRASGEWIGVGPLLLGLSCLGLFGYGLRRAISAQLRTSHVVAGWLNGASVMESRCKTPVFRTGKHTPTLTVVGLREPKVLVSENAIAALSSEELQTALRHESAHIRSRDNLKKLVFRFTAFPGMSDLEYAWSKVSEMAADDEAVSSLRDALDLAAALIKLSRQSPAQPSAELATALLHTSTESLKARVQRLFYWDVTHNAGNTGKSWPFVLSLSSMLLVGVVMAYPTLLVQMHTFTEWLVQ
jgi:Zn-dependent protease with chaperone function